MELLFLNVLLVGACVFILILIRAGGRVEKEANTAKGWFERWLTSSLPGRIDAFARVLWVRSLRRLKVLVLRLDNGLNLKLQRMKLEGGIGIKEEKIDLKKVVDRKNGRETGLDSGEKNNN